MTLAAMLLTHLVYGQQAMTLQEAVAKSISANKTLKAEETSVNIAANKIQSVKDARLPELGISGQMLYLPFAPTINNKLQTAPAAEGEGGASSQGFPVPKTVTFGGLNASLPIFTGFKLKNSLIQAEKAMELAKIASNVKTEGVAYQTLQLYYALYKTEQVLKVLDENIERTEQRIVDFGNFVENGLMAENDLLKAKLQLSNIQISKEEALNSRDNLTYKLNTWLDRAPDMPIATSLPSALMPLNTISNSVERGSLQLLNKQVELSRVGVELSKAAFYPNLALTAGYINLVVPNLLTVTNAVNLGVGLKYNISSLYKNKTEVKTARLQQQYAEQMVAVEKDNIKVEQNEATKNVELAIKKLAVYEQALLQAKENLRIVNNKYDNGLADTDQLLEAEVQYLQAEINQNVGVADQQLAWYQLQQTNGNLLESLQLNK